MAWYKLKTKYHCYDDDKALFVDFTQQIDTFQSQMNLLLENIEH